QMNKLTKFIISAAAMAIAMTASALNALPVDPEVRTGVLPNGLTYYLRHNERPSGQADFYIAMRVGSVNENDDQRGLAHFLEHMCFNGTRHFPGNSLITYLESLGVKFGANLNAYTSTDETVYNICEVPSARVSALDSCLLILRDWSNNLLLDPKEIDAERGVIKGEWRQRTAQASSRLLEKALPEIYPGSPYGYRMPIGSMEVVGNFKPRQLRDYYKKWYHPYNQCVIVVGDIDLDHMESQIRSLWSDVKSPKGAAAFNPPSIPANAAPIASVQTDPEQSASTISLYIKRSSLADSLDNTIASLRNDVVKSMVCRMLAERLTEVENSPESPIMSTAIGDMKFLLSRGQQAMILRTPVKKGRAADAVAVLSAEIKRAAVHGFLPTEFERALIDEKSEMEKAYSGRESTTNTDYARSYVRHYLDGGPLLSAEQRYKMMKGVVGQVKIADCEEYIRSLVKDGDADVVIVAYLPQTDTTTSADLVDAYTSVDGSRTEAYVDRAVSGDILKEEPVAGSIVEESELSAFGAKKWILSNGIVVYLRPSGHQADRVTVTGYSQGGFSQNYDPALAPEYKTLNDALAISAAGDYSADELRRLLVGKQVKVRVAVDNMDEGISASSSRRDLHDAFRLIHLKATALRPDHSAFDRLIDRQKTHVADNRSNPTFAMGDSIHAYVYGRHPLGVKLSPEAIAGVDYDKIFEIYRERFGDMSDFAFFVSGDFDIDSLRDYACRYLASLPAAGRMEKPKDIGYRYGLTPESARFTMPMQTPQSIVYSFYHSPCEFTLYNRILAQITG
ncbi:MAG: insulinase family protein, partial [Paramuribaculum sp.]|nr:insulinase family protein [Paramuribaculum sp.]